MAAPCVQKASNDPYQEPPDVPRNPEEEKYLERYEFLSRLAADEALEASQFGPDPSSWPPLSNRDGILAVVGSGIKAVCDFTTEAISLIKNADKVFYCVADPVTEVYIKSLSPDAQDLYVFYSNNKERYHTYVQMAEVMLCEVRKGLKVVTVYYGHPGVFVLPSHRAVQIARKQGLRAFLVPAVSALDCLVADVDFDPSFPGLQILEATDMLLRKRQILTDRHVVIWQVGCVGNPGYRRQGYLKENFAVLLDYLQEFYSPDEEIVHYIGSQFPTVSPVIERIPLSGFRSPEVAKHVTGISTFYIAPKDCVPCDTDMAQKMGLLVKPPSTPTKPTRTRSYDMYEAKEQEAMKNLENFEVPKGFAFTPLTAASNYIEELAQNPLKLQQHLKDPKKEISKHPNIQARDAVLLASGNAGRLMAAAAPPASNAAEDCAIKILTDRAFSHSYKNEMKRLQDDVDADKKLSQWLQLHGYDTNSTDVQAAFNALKKTSLFPWTNQYKSSIGTLAIHGVAPPGKSTVMWNDIPVNGFTMQDSVLKWTAGDKNDSSGIISFSVQNDLQVAVGKIWKKSETAPSANNFDGTTSDFRSPLQFWEGRYKTVIKVGDKVSTGKELEISFPVKTGKITLGGKEISPFNFDKTTLSWSNGKIKFFVQKKTASTPSITKFSGKLWDKGKTEPSSINFWGTFDDLYLKTWGGVYKTYIDEAGGAELVVQPQTPIQPPIIKYGAAIKKWQFDNPVISWSTADGNFTNAELRFHTYNDGSRGFSGKVWLDGSEKPATNNTKGVIDIAYLTSWSATYYTRTLKPGDASKTVESDLLQIIGTSDMTSSSVVLQGVEVRNWNYSGAKKVLSWKESDNNSNATITFGVSKPTSTRGAGVLFYGKYWKKGESEPKKTNWWGSFQAPTHTGSGGSRSSKSSFFSEENIVRNIVMGILVISIIEILKGALKLVEMGAGALFKKAIGLKKKASKKDNDETRERENEQESEEQPQDAAPEPPTNNEDPPPDTPSEDETPGDGNTPGDDNTPGEDENPSDGNTPGEDDTPVDDDNLPEDGNPPDVNIEGEGDNPPEDSLPPDENIEGEDRNPPDEDAEVDGDNLPDDSLPPDEAETSFTGDDIVTEDLEVMEGDLFE